VRVSDPGEVITALPSLLGFRPRESVVLVSLRGARANRLGLVVRADLPPEGAEEVFSSMLVRSVRTDGPSAVLIGVISETPDLEGDVAELPFRPLVHALVQELTGADVPAREVFLARAGRWWSYDCADPCCAPGAGRPLPTGVSAVEVAAVATGTVVAGDRDDLAGRIAAPDPAEAQVMAAMCEGVVAEWADLIFERGLEAAAEEGWTAITEAVPRCRPGALTARSPLSDREVARVVCALRDPDVRDRALGLALGVDAAAAEQLWTECTRRVPLPLVAPPATLLAVSTWLRGDGAMANIALDRALAGQPDYSFARLLATALDRCLPPDDLRQLLVASASEAGLR
jgi:Domain of unknown function (DUF4192)